MNFTKASDVDQVCWQLKLADYTRGLNRALINDLFNGKPPFTSEEVKENQIAVNVNFLEQTRLAHDARSQFYSAFTKPGRFFTATLDYGPQHKRNIWSTIVNKEVNRTMKNSIEYFEVLRSAFALDVLHGVGPSTYDNQDVWCPDAAGIEDILVPSGTLLTLRNLPFFAIYRTYTAPQLIKMTRGKKVDPAWNMELVEDCLKWIDTESTALMGTNWAEVWAPEKAAERMKGDSAIYASDAVPTINCFDFYFWNDELDKPGWNRRIILDSWGQPGVGGMARVDPISSQGKFLYDSGDRVYADDIQKIVNFQFADLSAVSPFQYHSVRSLGFLLYGVCHLQNRMRCKFNEAVFEGLMQYFRVKSADDAERALKIELVNRGVIDDSVQFIPAADRWQVNANLVELGLRENQGLITENSASYVQNQNFSRDRTEKTKFQVMAEMNAMTAMVGAALAQAYKYHTVQLREIFRRFMKKGSMDKQVKETQDRIRERGVPEKYLCEEYYDVEPEKIMGAGNKSLEMAISEQLMQYRNLYDPEPQREILRDVTLAITDDPARAIRLVPESPVRVSDAKHDAQLASAAIIMGLPVDVKTGINHIDYVETLLANFAVFIKKVEARGGMAKPEEIEGMQNLAKHIAQHIQIIAQDPNEKQRVRKYGDDLGQLMNMVKAYQQRLQEQMQKQAQQQGPQMDPKDVAKIEATKAMAQAKIETSKQSHAQKTAQRAISFEQKFRQDQAKMRFEGKSSKVKLRADLQAKDATTASEIIRNTAKEKSKPKTNGE